MLVLVWASLFGYQSLSSAALSSVNLAGYVNMISSARFWAAVRNTFLVAGGSAMLVTIIGALLSWTILRTRWPGRGVLDFVSFLSIGIPSVIAGLACMLLYLSLPIALYGTVWVLILAYSYRLAVTTRLSRAALMQIHGELEEAFTPQSVTITLEDEIDVSRGDMIVRPGNVPRVEQKFEATVVWMAEEPMVPGKSYWFKQTTKLTPGAISTLRYQIDVNTLHQTSQAAAIGTTIVILIIPVIFLMRRLLLGREAVR